MLEHIRLMAHYNEWMNRRLYGRAATLSEEELHADRGAFFRSIIGTLNHIAVGDILWLKRFASHPAEHPALDVILDLPMPKGLDESQANTLAELEVLRSRLDRTIGLWSRELQERDLDHALTFTNSKGIRSRRNFGSLVMHFFNHQTHHRGQVSTLLSQCGIDVGVTDLLALIPEIED